MNVETKIYRFNLSKVKWFMQWSFLAVFSLNIADKSVTLSAENLSPFMNPDEIFLTKTEWKAGTGIDKEISIHVTN